MADKQQIAGEILSGMGPGLLGGIGSALMGQKKPTVPGPPQIAQSQVAKPSGFKHGGKVEKTGIALVHKGETVIPAGKSKADTDPDDDDADDAPKLSIHRVVMGLHKGALHSALGVPQGTDIPKDKLAQAQSSSNPHVKAMANLAHTMSGWKH